jgi:hypothetical protein
MNSMGFLLNLGKGGNMKKYLIFLSLIVVILTVPLHARADYIVDTGTPSGDLAWALHSDQWLAAEFSLGMAYTLTDIEGYMLDNIGQLTVAIYGDGGEVPDTGNEFYSQSFTVPGDSQTPYDWYGLSGLSWSLLTGTYWVAFEVRAGDTYNGGMREDPPNPLADEAAKTSGPNYFECDGLYLGIKIQGTPGAPVPEPATMLLFGSGLAGLFGFRRKFRKK